jgi:hypothetical protein
VPADKRFHSKSAGLGNRELLAFDAGVGNSALMTQDRNMIGTIEPPLGSAAAGVRRG